jgi:hypothetical protein
MKCFEKDLRGLGNIDPAQLRRLLYFVFPLSVATAVAVGSAAPAAAAPRVAGPVTVLRACRSWYKSYADATYAAAGAERAAAGQAARAGRFDRNRRLDQAMRFIAALPEANVPARDIAQAKADMTVIQVSCVNAMAGLANSTPPLKPFPNDKAVYAFFVKKGLTSYQAAGVVGNLDLESKDNPMAKELGKCHPCGMGIAQWTGARWNKTPMDNLVWYAAALPHQPPPLRLGPQLDFIWYELKKYPKYGFSLLKKAPNVTDAVKAFERLFERPDPSLSHEITRIAYAEVNLAAYG